MSFRSGNVPPRKLTGPMRLDAAIGNAAISRSEKAILHAISRNVNFESWTCFPSVATIAKSAGYSERQTSTIIRRLQERGILHLDRKSRGGRDADGRGITHIYRLDIHALESLTNPEGTTGYTPKRRHANPEAIDNEPRSHCGQTNHPSNQLNKLPNAAPKPGGDSLDAGWMDGQNSTDLRAELVRHGIAGPNLDALVTSGRLTVDQVRAEAASISAGKRVRNKAAVLVKRLQAIAGIESARSKVLDPKDEQTLKQLEHIRRARYQDS